jgi:osmoprotectant transport system substrate-binding protein
MRTVVRFAAAAAGLAVVVSFAAACGSSGSSGTKAPVAAGSGGCTPIKDSSLVVLTDDKHLQASDNVVPAVNEKVNNPALLAALDTVSAALDTPKLVAMNKMVDVDKKTTAQAADAFAQQSGFLDSITQKGSGKIKIGTADFAENQEIAELYKLALAKAGYDASVQTVGKREVYAPALEKGQIQVVPEYAASLTTYLNGVQNGANGTQTPSGDIDKTMATLTPMATKAHLVMGKPSAAADQNAFAVTKALASKYNLATLSDFAAKCSGSASVLAGPAECPQRPFCQPGLDTTYGIKFGSFKSTDAGGPITKTAVTSGQATMGLVFSSDSSLSTS